MPIHDIREFRSVIKRERITIAVIAVPADAAQGVVNTVVAAGIKAILNFSPGTPQVPPDVKLKSVDLTVSLECLSFFLAQGEADELNGGRRGCRTSIARGRVRMVDVSAKPATAREAVARGRITHVAARRCGWFGPGA